MHLRGRSLPTPARRAPGQLLQGAGPGQLRTGSLTHPTPTLRSNAVCWASCSGRCLCSCCAGQARKKRPSAGSAPSQDNLPFFPEIHWCLLEWRSSVLDSSSHQRRGQEAVLPRQANGAWLGGATCLPFLLPHGWPQHFCEWGLGPGEHRRAALGALAPARVTGEGLLRMNAPRLFSRPNRAAR